MLQLVTPTVLFAGSLVTDQYLLADQSSNSSDKVIQPPTAGGSEAANARGGKARKITLLRRIKQIEDDHPQDYATLKASHVYMLQAGLAACTS